jgi:isoaspartyl peptidase/L-asparaginase-like protein (Ntn-hydrolase superfamily)
MTNPILLSTWSFGVAANRAAWPTLERGGSAVDAVELAAKDAEADPANRTVGFGGLPDRSGRVSLDAAIMVSPEQCGSVAFVRDFVHPISIARQVMESTPHVLLAGSGAEEFALTRGFTRQNLLTELSLAAYQRFMKGASEVDRSGSPIANIEEKVLSGLDAELADPNACHDTIGVLCRDSRGVLAASCTTSGMAWKLPGRVGDSPIIGHGLYVDPKHGAACCTGHGELVMGICGSFLAVEAMRRGASPRDAAIEVLHRLNESFSLGKEDQVGVIVLGADGQWFGASLRKGFRVAVKSHHQDELVDAGFVLFQ